VPEPVALLAIGRLVGTLRPDALIVDTSSVKSTVVPALHAAVMIAGEAEALSLNPMFAPSLGFAGHPVASVVVRDGQRGRALCDLIEQWGARVVNVTADQHDRLAAAAQALTHAAVIAFGAALAELDVDIADLDRIAPPPHTALLSLLARITSGAPEVYWDVQAANPYAPAARRALSRGVSQLSDVVEDDDSAAFGDLLDRLSGVLGPLRGAYRERSAKALRAMTTTNLTKETLG
jgi:prephenate dehydrogenase